MDLETMENPSTRRREWMAATCAVALGWMLHRRAAAATSAGFAEDSCVAEGPRSRRILVAYSSRYGSTASVAQAISAALCGLGHQVDLRQVQNVKDLAPYQAAVIGSPIYAGRWMGEAADFVKRNQHALSSVPTAYFTVCLTMKDDTPENRAKTMAYMDSLHDDAPAVRPVAVGLFGGVVDYAKMSFMHRAMLKSRGGPEGDFRNFAAVKAWSSEAVPALAAARRP
jgi:menaquinone-dependent protoporphyrinogen oxidase